MIICSLCSGRHATASCAIGLRHIEDCLSGTVDDYVQPMAEVIPLPFIARRSAPFGGVEAAGERWHPAAGRAWPTDLRNRGRGSEGLRVERLG